MLSLRYRIFRAVLHFLVRLLIRVDARGIERLPQTGPYIFVTNHLHMLDAPVIFALLGDRYATGFVGSTHRRNPLYRLVVQIVDGIWLHRGQPDRPALTTALEYLERGYILGIAPEGTRSKTGGLIPGKEGVAFLVYRARVPLYPIVVTRTEKVVQGWKRLRRPTVTVTVGEPFDLFSIRIEHRSQRLAVWTDEIMCRIAALLPPEYRGVYADHPRLKELLTSPGE